MPTKYFGAEVRRDERIKRKFLGLSTLILIAFVLVAALVFVLHALDRKNDELNKKNALLDLNVRELADANTEIEVERENREKLLRSAYSLMLLYKAHEHSDMRLSDKRFAAQLAIESLPS